MKRFSLMIVVLILSAMSITSCEEVVDSFFSSSESIDETFNYTDFYKIDVSSALTVKLTQADEFSVTATGSEKDLEKLEIKMNDNTIYLDVSGSYENITINISMPNIESINVDNASDIIIVDTFKLSNDIYINLDSASDFSGDLVVSADLELSLASASSIELSGSVNNLKLTLSSASDGDLKDFEAITGTVKASSASSADVTFTEASDISATSASDITVYGKGSVNIIKETGASSIKIKK